MVMIRCCTGLPGAEGNGENQASFLGLLLDPPPPRSSPTARSPPPHSSNQGAPGPTLPNTEGVVVSRKGTRRCPKIAPRTFKCRDRHQRRAIHHPERTRKPQTKDHALCQAELASDHIGPHIPRHRIGLVAWFGIGRHLPLFLSVGVSDPESQEADIPSPKAHVMSGVRSGSSVRSGVTTRPRVGMRNILMPAIPSFASPGVHHALTWLLDGSQQRRRDTVVAIEDDSGTPRLTPPPPCKQAPAPTARFRISPLGVAGCHRHCWLNRATVHLIILSLNCLSGPAGDVGLLR